MTTLLLIVFLLFCHSPNYRENIYSFAVNTINIFIECNENMIFTSAKHEWKFEFFSLHEMKLFMAFAEKE